jgi:hypothetical protein
MDVQRMVRAAVAAVVLLAAPALVPLPAAADVHVSIDPGAVAYGYNDGYWDRNHRWHRWPATADRDWYRAHYGGHYYDQRHDRAPEQGWRSSDRWWDHH